MSKASLRLDIWTEGRKRLPADHSELAQIFAPHLERVKDLCEEGCQSGDLYDQDFGFRGWWTIESH